MNPEEEKHKDPDMEHATPALLRAANRARKLAAQTGTAIVVVRDGKLVHEYPSSSTERGRLIAQSRQLALVPRQPDSSGPT
jgi:hypothetical protein